ncbi:MAG: hypothetical protein J0L62_01530 [Bacteroidetes bacterium]|nr:hypothetical protein [Bacteroidota bacterium]
MLEPDEFEFYDLLDAYKERFGIFPPTHHLDEKLAMKLIRKSLEDDQPIPDTDGTPPSDQVK